MNAFWFLISLSFTKATCLECVTKGISIFIALFRANLKSMHSLAYENNKKRKKKSFLNGSREWVSCEKRSKGRTIISKTLPHIL